ncbi:D-amino-acid transaminase [Bacillaceae bacterium]
MILYQDLFVERAAARIDIEDRGYQFGDGVYEVIRVYNGRLFALEPHLQRLKRSAAEIRLPLPYSTDKLAENLHLLLKHNKLTNGQVYLQVTRGAAARIHHFPEKTEPVLVAYTVETKRPLRQLETGIKGTFVEDIRWLRCDIKSLNLLGNVLAKQRAKENGCDEAILHREGTVTEGSSSNVFLVKDDVLYTHPANRLILNGITRSLVLDLAQALHLPVKEEPFTTERLLHGDEAFVTSTTLEIMPVVAIDGTTIGGGKPGPVTRKLQQAFAQLIG